MRFTRGRRLLLGLVSLFAVLTLAASAAVTPTAAEAPATAEPAAPTIDLGADFDPAALPAALDKLYPSNDARPPVILIHGWMGFAEYKVDCDDNDPLDPDYDYVDDEWEQVDEQLQALGFPVDFVRSKSGYTDPFDFDSSPPNCTPVVEENAPRVAEAIDRVLASPEAAGQEKVILIGKSMGGLVARAYLESALYRDDVAAVFTLGTPHLGSTVNLLTTWIEILTFGFLTLAEYCVYQPVACQFSDNEAANPPGYSGIESFNADHPNRAPGVRYHLVSGNLGFDHRSILCEPLYILLPGPNDCIVPLPSGLGQASADGGLGPLSGPIDRWQVYAAHIEDFADRPNWPFRDYTYTYENKNLYDGTLFGSVRLQDLPAETLTKCVWPVIDSRLPDQACGTVSDLTNTPVALPATTPVERTPAESVRLTAGSRLVRDFWLPGGDAVFTLIHQAGTVDVQLIAPDGARYRVSADDAGVAVKSDSRGSSITVSDAAAGRWRLEARVLDAPADGTQVLSFATFAGGAPWSISLDRDSYAAGATATVTVDGAFERLRPMATLTTRSGEAQTVALTPAADGYRGTFTVPDDAGYAQLTVTLVDSRTGYAAAERSRLLQIASADIRLNGRYAARPIAGGLPGLAIDIGVASDVAGRAGVSAELVDAAGHTVAHSAISGPVTVGDSTLTLIFRGDGLRDGGSFALRNVHLSDHSRAGVTAQTAAQPFATQAFSAAAFAAPAFAAPAFAAPDTAGVTAVANVPEVPHSCALSAPANPAGYTVGESVSVDCTVTLTPESTPTEWLDHYFIDAPAAWQLNGQTVPPGDQSGWNRPTVAQACAAQSLGYWGLANPHFSASTGNPAPFDLIAPCDVNLNNLPVAGSFAGPWQAGAQTGVAFPREGFEGAFPPAGWTRWDTQGAGYNTGWQASSSRAFEGTLSAFHNDDSTCFFCTSDIESWLVLPLHFVQTGDQLVWRHLVRGDESGFASDFDLWVSTASGNPNDGQFIEKFDLFYGTYDQWGTYTYDLTEFVGLDIYIAFRYFGDDDEELYLDAVEITRPEPAGATYSFGADFTVQPGYACPGSDVTGISADPTDAVANLACVALGDQVNAGISSAPECQIARACPLPQLTVEKTVSSDGACPGAARAAASADGAVTLCYTVTNTSPDVTLTSHSLFDSAWGQNVVINRQEPLAPGASLTFTVELAAASGCSATTATVTSTTEAGFGQPQGASADAPFVDTRYAVTATTAAPLCVDG